MRSIIWSKPAEADLIGAYQWYNNEAPPEVAVRVLLAIKARCDFLTSFPYGGPPIESGLRKLRVLETPYLIIYRVEKEHIFVVRLFHEREDWQIKI
jgi:plasmid stabilization system protein ParE